jgi:hypothetical protein
MDEKELIAAMGTVAMSLGLHGADGDTDILIVSHEINRRLYNKLSERLGAEKRAKAKALVFLNTQGGDPHAGFRIARCLRYHYKHVRIAVPHMCKSAGTLIAIGADVLAVGDRGELGPLDIQISNRKEIFERSSGLDYTEALRALSEQAQSSFRDNVIEIRAGSQMPTKLAGDFACQLAIGSVAPMYAQIDPIQVGEVYRAMKIAHEYGRRLNDQTRQLKPEAMLKLVSGYPDHSFVIDRKEAEELFSFVEPLTASEASFVTTLWPFFKGEARQCLLIEPSSAEVDEDEDADTEAKSAKGDTDDGNAAEPEREAVQGNGATSGDEQSPARGNASPEGVDQSDHAGQATAT